MTEGLNHLLKSLAAFDDQELIRISYCFKRKSLKRNTFLLRAGEVCQEFYFVYKGCLRTYFVDRQGNEKTRYVMLDGTIGTALTSFIAQKPSFEFIEALDNSELLAISYRDFYRLLNEIAHWKDFYQKILEMAYSFQNRKIEDLVTLTATQRYQKIVKEKPVLIQRLSNRILASDLDIKPETLSRLKSR